MEKANIKVVGKKEIGDEIIPAQKGQSNSFSFTFRPLNGVVEGGELEKRVIKMCKKHYAVLVYEKEEESRHLHGQVWLQKPQTLGDFKKACLRIQSATDPDWNDNSKHCLMNGKNIRMCWDDNFVDKYLSKEDGVDGINWLINNRPSETSVYYPTQEQQEQFKDKANAVDKKFHKWKVDYEEWIERNPEIHTYTQLDRKVAIARFLSTMMFREKKYMVVIDERKCKQNSNALFQYVYPKDASYYQFLGSDDAEIHRDMMETKYQSTPTDH